MRTFRSVPAVKAGLFLTLFFALALFTACTKVNNSAGNSSEPTPTVTPEGPTSTPTPTVRLDVSQIDYSKAEVVGDAPEFSRPGSFYEEGFELIIRTEKPCVIYYTENGREPDTSASSIRYEGPISVEATSGDYPKACVIKAKAFYEDGTVSPTAAHTYFVAEGITTRFTDSSEKLFIVSLIGEHGDFLGGPSGILYRENYKTRGDASERPAHIEILDAAGNLVVSQFGGVRVYGAYSRRNEVKSLKLFARKSYGSGIGKFKYDFFGTPTTAGETVNSYDKLVLRSYGNDWQFAFLRDELNQRLIAKSGFPFYEAVVPAIVYLNGSFYNFVWMHESYCDTYFKQKFPSETLRGNFVVIGGTETKKSPDADENDVGECEEFNAAYDELIKLDLTDDANFRKLTEFLDVENYLDYYAFNVFVCNADWPHNNYKVFRYYADESGLYGEGVYDGRWRCLPHDMDYCYNIYSSPNECTANVNYIKKKLTKVGDQRYSPLFTNLIAREDCRNYFIKKYMSLVNGAFSVQSVNEELDAMAAEQGRELEPYIESMKKTYNTGGWGWGGGSIWTSLDNVKNSRNNIRNYVTERVQLAVSQLAEAFDLTEAEVNAIARN